MPTNVLTDEDNIRIIKRIAVARTCNARLKQNRFKLARNENEKKKNEYTVR